MKRNDARQIAQAVFHDNESDRSLNDSRQVNRSRYRARYDRLFISGFNHTESIIDYLQARYLQAGAYVIVSRFSFGLAFPATIRRAELPHPRQHLRSVAIRRMRRGSEGAARVIWDNREQRIRRHKGHPAVIQTASTLAVPLRASRAWKIWREHAAPCFAH